MSDKRPACRSTTPIDSLAPTCIEGLSDPVVVRPCADILLSLETTEALPHLRAAAAAAPRAPLQRHLTRVVSQLEAYATADTP